MKKSRDAMLKTEILNSSDKRMAAGEKPGPVKTTAEIRRGKRKKRGAISDEDKRIEKPKQK
jgi:hypothetical protein